MTTYNGHRSWNSWNVSLWIANDEGLYRSALCYMERSKSLAAAARAFLLELPRTTPDGAKYNFTCVLEALRGLKD